MDVQLKGPRRTPFSRDGDGRAASRSEYISEAMAALGVPTIRVLAAVTTRSAGAKRDRRWPMRIGMIDRADHGGRVVGVDECAGAIA